MFDDAFEDTMVRAEKEAAAVLKIIRVLKKVKNPKMRIAILNLACVQVTGNTLEEFLERRES